MKKLLFIIIVSVLISFQIVQVKAQTVGWTQLSFNPSQPLYSVYCLNYNTVIAVGANGYIVKTTDGGTNWNVIPSNTNNTLYKVCFVDDSTGYAAGVKGTVLKTTNFGQSWANIGINTNLNFFSLSFINKDTGWVSGGEGTFLVQAGNKGILIKTINGGASWIVDSTYNATISSVLFLNNDTGYIAVCNDLYFSNKLKKTINSGITYATIQQDSFPTMIYSFNNIHFINNKTGYFVKSGNYNGIYKTNDYGMSWINIINNYFPIMNTFIVDSCSLYYTWWDNTTGTTGNGFAGENICINNRFDSSNVSINDFYFINEDYGFCVGSNIYKRGLITNINEIKDDNEIKISPNPFNDKTTVTINLSIANSDICINVYNSIGQKIINKTLIKNSQFEIDLTGNPSGFYHLILQVGGKPIQSENLIKL